MGVWQGPPNADEAPKPTSSSSTISTLGAPSGGSSGSIGGERGVRVLGVVRRQARRRPVGDRQDAAGVPVWAHGSSFAWRSADREEPDARAGRGSATSPVSDHPPDGRFRAGADLATVDTMDVTEVILATTRGSASSSSPSTTPTPSRPPTWRRSRRSGSRSRPGSTCTRSPRRRSSTRSCWRAARTTPRTRRSTRSATTTTSATACTTPPATRSPASSGGRRCWRRARPTTSTWPRRSARASPTSAARGPRPARGARPRVRGVLRPPPDDRRGRRRRQGPGGVRRRHRARAAPHRRGSTERRTDGSLGIGSLKGRCSMTATDHLLRDLAPIPDRAWKAIDAEASERLTPLLAARRLTDWSGPGGWRDDALSLGRTDALDGAAGRPRRRRACTQRRRRVLPSPSSGCRSPCAGARSTTSSAAPPTPSSTTSPGPRGSPPISRTARCSTAGPPPASTGIDRGVGLPAGRAGRRLPGVPRHRRAGGRPLRQNGIGGPYALAIGPERYTRSSRPPSTAATCWWTT